MRDDIQPKGLMISTTLRAVMIYQVCDLDKKILQKMYPFLQYFLVELRSLVERGTRAPSLAKDGNLPSRPYTAVTVPHSEERA